MAVPSLGTPVPLPTTAIGTEGTCAGCKADIIPGERVVALPHGPVHLNCPRSIAKGGRRGRR